MYLRDKVSLHETYHRVQVSHMKLCAFRALWLVPLRLSDLNAPTIEAWAAKEAKDRPARVRLALRLLKAFLRWAASEPDLKGKADPTAASAKKARAVADKAKPKNDYI